MVKKYVHFRRVKEIQENVQRMKMETNVNERVLLSFGTALPCVSVNNINEPKTHALFSKMVINQKRQFVFIFLFLPV